MGFWSGLAKIGGAIAAPFTGGASLALTGLGALGGAAGNASAGRAQGRLDQQQADIERNRALMDAVAADLAQRKFQAGNFQTGANTAIRGGLLQGLQDVNVTAPPGVNMGTVTGGARPSAINNRVGIGQIMERHGIDTMNTNQNYTPLMGIPQLPAQPQAGKLDKFLNIFGSIAPLLGSLGSLKTSRSGYTDPHGWS